MIPYTEILFIAAACYWFAELTTFPQTVAHAFKRKRLKPFDCPLCLAWWLGLIYFLIVLGWNIHAPAYAIMCSIAAVMMDKIVRRWF